MEKIRKRSEIPVEDTWATEDLYATDEAWEQQLNKRNNEVLENKTKAYYMEDR